jgi:hypothetical protein
MITKKKLSHGEGDIFEENPLIGLRKRTSHSEKMASEDIFLMMRKTFKKNSSPCQR